MLDNERGYLRIAEAIFRPVAQRLDREFHPGKRGGKIIASGLVHENFKIRLLVKIEELEKLAYSKKMIEVRMGDKKSRRLASCRKHLLPRVRRYVKNYVVVASFDKYGWSEAF